MAGEQTEGLFKHSTFGLDWVSQYWVKGEGDQKVALDVQRITGTTAKIAARLCNFDTGTAYLNRSHVNFLDQEVASVVRGMLGCWVDLFGYASRRGDINFNLNLSHHRTEAVKRRISQYTSHVNFQIQSALGESDSGPNERNNDGYYRAVEVYVYGFRPPPPKPLPVIISGSTDFMIRVAGGISLSIPVLKGPQIDHMMFQIIDAHHRRAMFFSFADISIGPPSLPGLPISFGGVGPLSKFRTTVPVHLVQFEGPCAVFQDPGANLGNLSTPSKIRISFDTPRLLEAHARVVPSMVPMDGGPGLQTPSTGSATIRGFLTHVSKEIPFTG